MVVSLRPVVKKSGARLSEEEHRALLDVRVVKSVGVPDYARLSFAVGEHGPTITPKLGDGLHIGVDGSNASDWTLFDGVVVGLGIELGTGFDQTVVVEAYDRLYLLGRTSLASTHLNQTVVDVIRALAGAAGLQAQIDNAVGSTTRPSAYRYGTAYAYIDHLVRHSGCEWWVEGSTLHIAPRAGSSSPTLTATVGNDLRSFSARVNATDHVDEVTVTGWDVTGKKPIVATASADGKGTRSNITLAQPSEIEKSAVGGKKAVSIPKPVADQTEATKLAKGLIQQSEASLLRARGELTPDPALAPGASIEVKGLGTTWDGTYYCTEVEHVWGGANGSLRSFFEVGSAEPESLVDLFGSSAAAPLERMLGSVTIGIVTDNNDPDKLNRVKLKLPYLSDTEETSWARVLQVGSGSSRGWTVLPEVDDEVLVGFEHGDIDRPYVLGGLVNGKDTLKYSGTALVDGGKVLTRSFTSRLGHEILVSDGSQTDKQFVQINTAGNEAIVFAGKEKLEVQAQGIPVKVYNDQGSIEIAKNGDITIEGNKVTIKAKQDLALEGLNVNVKSKASTKVEASASLDLKGTAPVTLESSAITTVKGTMVKIN